MKNWLICNGWRIINFRTKILSEDPYLKFFIRRVLCSYRERFSSFSRYATRLPVEAFFLPPLHRGASTIAVKECCGYMICRACGESTYYGELKRRIEDEPHIAINLNQKNLLKCPFCREIPVPSTPLRERSLENLVKRGNNEAMCQLAGLYLYHCSLLSLFECCDGAPSCEDDLFIWFGMLELPPLSLSS